MSIILRALSYSLIDVHSLENQKIEEEEAESQKRLVHFVDGRARVTRDKCLDKCRGRADSNTSVFFLRFSSLSLSLSPVLHMPVEIEEKVRREKAAVLS